MQAQDLTALARVYVENREFIPNEETAKMALIVPFLRCLGYDPNSPKEVRAEFSAPFTQGDGKRVPDRMDYAVFGQDGVTPLFVVEAKPLGSDLRALSNQLARYISQMPELHFGLITDGCRYLFYGDLDQPNVMDAEPFFVLELDHEQTDWERAAKFLNKFSRDRFDAEALVTDAENSRYKQALSDKLKAALADPGADDRFLRWLTDGVYTGKRTAGVMERLGKVAKEAVEPALMAFMSDSFVEGLRSRIASAHVATTAEAESDADSMDAPDEDAEAADENGVVTTDEEIEFHRFAQAICERAGYDASNVLYRDTRSYFNVSYRKPTKWFLRLFAGDRRKTVFTRVAEEDVKRLSGDFTTKTTSWGCGVEIDEVAQLWALQDLVVQSLQALEAPAPSTPEGEASA